MKLGPRQLELVAALRSGRYTKTTGRLRRDNCYCVEGVACDVSGLGCWCRDYSAFAYVTEHSMSGITAQKDIREYYGFQDDLWELNDQEDLSFPGMADRLEAYPKVYFKESL
jgi:hypothetical protein